MDLASGQSRGLLLAPESDAGELSPRAAAACVYDVYNVYARNRRAAREKEETRGVDLLCPFYAISLCVHSGDGSFEREAVLECVIGLGDASGP